METTEELISKLREARESKLNEMWECERSKKLKGLIGKHFKLRDIYTKVIDIKKCPPRTGFFDNETILYFCNVIQFQATKNGSIAFESCYKIYTNGFGEEISLDEFDIEFDKVINNISKLRD